MRTGNPFFLALADSAGIRKVLRFRSLVRDGTHPAGGAGGSAPGRLSLVARQGADSVALAVQVVSANATPGRAPGAPTFLQLRGRFVLSGQVESVPVADSGYGFFETFVP
jgi:hypothetical protein